MEDCKKRMAEATKDLGHRKEKFPIKDCFLFSSWLDSNISTEYAKDLGSDLIYTTKTNN